MASAPLVAEPRVAGGELSVDAGVLQPVAAPCAVHAAPTQAKQREQPAAMPVNVPAADGTATALAQAAVAVAAASSPSSSSASASSPAAGAGAPEQHDAAEQQQPQRRPIRRVKSIGNGAALRGGRNVYEAATSQGASAGPSDASGSSSASVPHSARGAATDREHGHARSHTSAAYSHGHTRSSTLAALSSRLRSGPHLNLAGVPIPSAGHAQAPVPWAPSSRRQSMFARPSSMATATCPPSPRRAAADPSTSASASHAASGSRPAAIESSAAAAEWLRALADARSEPNSARGSVSANAAANAGAPLSRKGSARGADAHAPAAELDAVLAAGNVIITDAIKQIALASGDAESAVEPEHQPEPLTKSAQQQAPPVGDPSAQIAFACANADAPPQPSASVVESHRTSTPQRPPFNVGRGRIEHAVPAPKTGEASALAAPSPSVPVQWNAHFEHWGRRGPTASGSSAGSGSSADTLVTRQIARQLDAGAAADMLAPASASGSSNSLSSTSTATTASTSSSSGASSASSPSSESRSAGSFASATTASTAVTPEEDSACFDLGPAPEEEAEAGADAAQVPHIHRSTSEPLCPSVSDAAEDTSAAVHPAAHSSTCIETIKSTSSGSACGGEGTASSSRQYVRRSLVQPAFLLSSAVRKDANAPIAAQFATLHDAVKGVVTTTLAPVPLDAAGATALADDDEEADADAARPEGFRARRSSSGNGLACSASSRDALRRMSSLSRSPRPPSYLCLSPAGLDMGPAAVSSSTGSNAGPSAASSPTSSFRAGSISSAAGASAAAVTAELPVHHLSSTVIATRAVGILPIAPLFSQPHGTPRLGHSGHSPVVRTTAATTVSRQSSSGSSGSSDGTAAAPSARGGGGLVVAQASPEEGEVDEPLIPSPSRFARGSPSPRKAKYHDKFKGGALELPGFPEAEQMSLGPDAQQQPLPLTSNVLKAYTAQQHAASLLNTTELDRSDSMGARSAASSLQTALARAPAVERCDTEGGVSIASSVQTAVYTGGNSGRARGANHLLADAARNASRLHGAIDLSLASPAMLSEVASEGTADWNGTPRGDAAFPPGVDPFDLALEREMAPTPPLPPSPMHGSFTYEHVDNTPRPRRASTFDDSDQATAWTQLPESPRKMSYSSFDGFLQPIPDETLSRAPSYLDMPAGLLRVDRVAFASGDLDIEWRDLVTKQEKRRKRATIVGVQSLRDPQQAPRDPWDLDRQGSTASEEDREQKGSIIEGSRCARTDRRRPISWGAAPLDLPGSLTTADRLFSSGPAQSAVSSRNLQHEPYFLRQPLAKPPRPAKSQLRGAAQDDFGMVSPPVTNSGLHFGIGPYEDAPTSPVRIVAPKARTARLPSR